MNGKKVCFVISPIGEEGSEIRKRSDQILKHVITPPATQCGYETLRADKMAEPGIITSQIIQHILEDPLVVADLTGMNPNVFYELAIRHAIRKPLVQIIQKGEKIPFDVAGMRTIQFDYRDLESVDEAKAEIEKQIRNVEGKSPEQIESPISATVDLQTLKKSERPEERTLGEILSVITELRTDVNQLKRLNPYERIKDVQLMQLDKRRAELRSQVAMLQKMKDELNHSASNIGDGENLTTSKLRASVDTKLKEIDFAIKKALDEERHLCRAQEEGLF